MTLPVSLSTPRLSLHPHTLADFDDSAALWADPVVTQHVGGRPFTSEESWSRLLRYVGHWAVLGYGYWVVREGATGRFVGEVGFGDFHRGLGPSFDGAPEGGWVLAPWAHGKGFGTEAVRAALAWIETQRGTSRTVCLIDELNVASIHLAQKCGYNEWQRASYKGTPAILFERLKAVLP